MTTKLLPLAVGCALALAACSREAPAPPAAPKEAPKAAEAGRPMPPAAPTAAPAEGDKHEGAKKDEAKK